MSLGTNRHKPLLILFVVCFFSLGPAGAQTVITHSSMVGVGQTRVLDTYLSAEHFKGEGLSFVSTVERQRPDSRWTTLIEHEANLSSVKDRSHSQQEIEGAYNIYWGKLYGWQMLDGNLTLQAGGLANGSLGIIYNTSNGNNPAQARLHLNIMPTGAATYHFQLFRRQLTARYELSLPLCGLAFSPNYGQSYYEIFSRGDYDHNAVPTTFVSAPEWRHMLTIDARLWRHASLRIGYLGNMQQHKVNNLRQHVYTHRFMIGVTRSFSIIHR
ncbi:MAG: DUF3316 domain-containing protein [Prevotella sp.]|nr:DUF3316 domain-containing protein [Prevotella sp.]